MPIRPILFPPIPCLPIRIVCIRLSLVRFLPMEKGDFLRPLSVYLDREGFNTTSQVNMWHVVCIITGAHCGEKIYAMLCSRVAVGVVFGEIVCEIVLSSHIIYQKLSLPGSVSEQPKSYVYGSWTYLADVVIEKSVSCGAVLHFWGGCLGVPHLYERYARCCDSTIVYKKGSKFCFHCAG